jgi:hypothetical protein
MHSSPSPEDMLESLRRSGYLLEGRIVDSLNQLNMFVESNVAYLDKKTGVSREVDIVAESYRYSVDRPKLCVKTTFVIEAVNNPLPAVVMTPYRWTPNVDEEQFLPYCITPRESDGEHPFAGEVSLSEIKAKGRSEVFCQYCGFSKKKGDGEWMASHPDELYGAIKKSVEYTMTLRDIAAEWMSSSSDEYWRIFQWRPVIAFGGALFALREGKIEAVDRTQLRFNFHWRDEARSAIVDFVCESALSAWVAGVADEDESIESTLHDLRSGGA